MEFGVWRQVIRVWGLGLGLGLGVQGSGVEALESGIYGLGVGV